MSLAAQEGENDSMQVSLAAREEARKRGLREASGILETACTTASAESLHSTGAGVEAVTGLHTETADVSPRAAPATSGGAQSLPHAFCSSPVFDAHPRKQLAHAGNVPIIPITTATAFGAEPTSCTCWEVHGGSPRRRWPPAPPAPQAVEAAALEGARVPGAAVLGGRVGGVVGAGRLELGPHALAHSTFSLSGLAAHSKKQLAQSG